MDAETVQSMLRQHFDNSATDPDLAHAMYQEDAVLAWFEAMKKQYAGHAKRVMFGVWSFLRQFMYTKMIIVTDDDVNIREWKEVVWALTTRVDPARDTLIVPNTPIDYLDFASPVAGLGSKIGIDATNKWPGETARQWGRPIAMDPAITARVEAIWSSLGG